MARVSSVQRLVDVLGGAKVLRVRVSSQLELIPLIRGGLDYAAFEAVVAALQGNAEELAKSLGVARRTLDRRRLSRKLDPDTSERVVRLASVAARASDVLGDVAAMRRWLRGPNRALGGQTPLSLLDTEQGAQVVLDVLGRLEHGVYS
jgi:putative toxin-antitoxin system antitoxin component (TIGR02293 family)